MKRQLPTPAYIAECEAAAHTPIDKTLTDMIEGAKARVQAHADAGLPPQVTRGESSGDARETVKLVLENGVVKEVLQRRGHGGQFAFLDWINFTVHEETFWHRVAVLEDPPVTWLGEEPPLHVQHSSINEDRIGILNVISADMERIFGFGITAKRAKGANFYDRSYVLGDGYGLVCIGGQRDTVLVSLSGTGCAASKPGWEERLQVYLEKSIQPRITRVDLAYDDYAGAHNVHHVNEWFDAGLFNTGGRNPEHELRGNWRRPNGKGLTVYIGSRMNGKFFRAYEKGRQLGDPSSSWLRFEVEFKSVDRVIPFDVLTAPGAYLAAAYPALAFIDQRQERILTTKKTLEITYSRTLEWLKTQCGRALWVAREIEGSSDELLNKIMRVGEVPPRLRVPTWLTTAPPMHRSIPGAIQ